MGSNATLRLVPKASGAGERVERPAPRWSGEPLAPPSEAALRQLRLFPCRKVLQVGCGTGALLARLPGDVSGSGIELLPRELAAARRRLGAEADLRLGDPAALPWADRSFDAVVCVDALHRWPRPAKALSEMRRVLDRRGRLILVDLWLPPGVRQLANLLSPLRPSGEVRAYSRDQLSVLLGQAGFYALEWAGALRGSFVVVARV